MAGILNGKSLPTDDRPIARRCKRGNEPRTGSVRAEPVEAPRRWSRRQEAGTARFDLTDFELSSPDAPRQTRYAVSIIYGPFDPTNAATSGDEIRHIYRSCNREKGNRTPWGAWGHTERWEIIADQVSRIHKSKQWRFAPDAMERFEHDGGFIARQLTDTQYLSRMARAYLSSLYPESTGVYVIPGRMTAMLRRLWGLNELLPDHNYVENQHSNGNYIRDATGAKCATGCRTGRRSDYRRDDRRWRSRDRVGARARDGANLPYRRDLSCEGGL